MEASDSKSEGDSDGCPDLLECPTPFSAVLSELSVRMAGIQLVISNTRAFF